MDLQANTLRGTNALEVIEALQQRIAQLEEELAHSHRLATLGTLSAAVSHEYHNLLTPVLGYAQLAKAQPDNDKLIHKAIDRALTGAQQCIDISESVLQLARPKPTQTHASLKLCIEHTLACLACQPARDGVEIQVDVPDAELNMPPVHVQQVLINLTLNALAAMQGQRRRGGLIRIHARASADNRLSLVVEDNGPGVPDAVAARLFQPFVSQRDINLKPGTGLGLGICRQLVEKAGGSIVLHNRPGQGAAFELLIPLASPAAALERPAA